MVIFFGQVNEIMLPIALKVNNSQISPKRVCLIEDDPDIQNLIIRFLEMESFSVKAFASWGEFTLSKEKLDFDVLVLDWMLPGKSGLEILRELRQSENFRLKRLPVLMVTARVEDVDIIRALEAGADDYVTKPFSPSVLVARIQSLFRRLQFSSQENQALENKSTKSLFLGNFKIDQISHRAFLGPRELLLTPSEFGMMVALIENAGSVLTRNQLIERLKGPGVNVVERTIDNYVLSLRKKLGESGHLLETVRGIGYRVLSGEIPEESATQSHGS
jgi:DNA-binding response OmpR family regulator